MVVIGLRSGGELLRPHGRRRSGYERLRNPSGGAWAIDRAGSVVTMDAVLPPTPDDARWTAPSMRLDELEVVLELDHHLAQDWATGQTKTVLGTSIRVREPLVRSLDGPGMEVHLPLAGVAGMALLTAVHRAGADPENLRSVCRNLEHDHRGPVMASRMAAAVFPPALAAAATQFEDASMLAPVARSGPGWVFDEPVAAVIADMRYDDDGWVTEVCLARIGAAEIIADASGPSVRPVGAASRDDAAVDLFLRGKSVAEVAAVLGCSGDEIEDVIRQRMC